ncbi:MAG: ABC transporter permease [Prevotella sp.]|nr:ABC transporter permease [Prevotella sp.]
MLSFLIQKEFLQIRRNAFLPRLIIAFPVMVMCIMPWVMNMEVKNIVVDVVDNDRSRYSQQLVHSIEASRYFIFNGQKPTYAVALDDIQKSRADVAVVIRQGYGKRLSNGQPVGSGDVLIAANAVNGTKGAIGSSYLTQIIVDELASKQVDELIPETNNLSTRQLVNLSTLYNKGQNYKVFMIPALLAIVVMLMCGFLPALNIVSEKETGTIEQINVTPVSKHVFILSKLIPYWMIALAVVSICLVLSWLVYGIVSQGSLWLVYMLAMLLALFFSSLGLVISNHSDTLQQAIFVMWFFVVCMLLLSGLFTPTRSMPTWAFATTYVNPMSHFIEAVRTVFVRGGSFPSISSHVYALAGLSLLMAVWAVRSYKKNQ